MSDPGTEFVEDLNNLRAIFEEEMRQQEARYQKQVSDLLEKAGFPHGTYPRENMVPSVRFITEDKGGHEIAIDVNFASVLIAIPARYSYVAYVRIVSIERTETLSGARNLSIRRFLDAKALAVPYTLEGRREIRVSVKNAPYVVKQLAEYVKNENFCG